MLLSVNRLSVNTGAISLLSDINFSLKEGSLLVIAGKNGSGKSTLLKAVSGLLPESYKVTGTSLFKDQDLISMKEEDLFKIRREQIKCVFQDSINSFNPIKKLKYYFENFYGEKSLTENLLEYFFLPSEKQLSALYPYELSGGMAQRISLVLALRADPELLILDEPTANIDSPVVNLLIEKLKSFIKSDGKGILLVTQDLSFARELCTEIAYMDNGRLSEPAEKTKFFSAGKSNNPLSEAFLKLSEYDINS